METAKVYIEKDEEEEEQPPKIELDLLLKNLLENACALYQMGDVEVLAADS